MSELDNTVFAFPAQIVTARATDTALLNLAKQRASDPTIFDVFNPYFWPARISTDRLDAFFTRMRPSSLKNYAAEADAGVAFQDSHKTDGLVRTLGHSLTGKYADPQGNGVAHTDADFYTVLGMDPAIDAFVNKMRAGLVRDVSIGFYGGTYICSICNQPLWPDGDCFHYPGFSYSVKDESGTKTGQKVLCTADVEDAHLSEVSGVYDGATPGAVILKAQRDAAAGRIRPDAAQILEARYRIHLPIATRHPGVDMPGPTTEDISMPPETTITIRLEDLPPEQVRSLFEPIGITADSLVDGIRQLAERDAKQAAELARLTPLAKDGEEYRKRHVDAAMGEYVRFCAATGKTVTDEDQAAKRTLLERSLVAEVDVFGAGWGEQATLKLGGGRQTVDGSERDDKPAVPERKLPDAAYRSGRA